MATPKSNIIDLDVILSKFYNHEIEVLEETMTIVTKPSRFELITKIKRKLLNEEDTVNLFVKLFEEDAKVNIRVDLLTRFKKEVEIYHSTIPAVCEFQRASGIPEPKLYYHLFPKCITARVSVEERKNVPDKSGVIILENLKAQGYIMADAKKGFDFESSKLIISKLAEFHAIPLAMRLLRLDAFKEKVVLCMIDIKQHNKKSKYYKDIDGMIQEGIRGNDELTPYLESIHAAIQYSKLNSWFRKSFTDETWITLCHSNYCIFNLMLQINSEGKPISCKIIDLQMLEYLHCCTDLIFFLFTSVDNDVLKTNYDVLVKWYYDAFMDALTDFQVFLTPYTFEKYSDEYNNQGPKMIIKILQMLPYIACEGYEEDGEPILGPRYKKKMKDTLLLMISKGWIEE